MGIGPLACTLALTLGLALGGAAPAAAQSVPGVIAYVTRIVDGDTIYAVIGNRMEAIRYLGINTPEVYDAERGELPAGLVATDANRRLVEGRWVTLTFDATPRDRFGRLLAYVWVNGQLVNAHLVHQGYAQAVGAAPGLFYGPYLAGLQKMALEAGRGLWASRGFRFKTDASEHTDSLVVSRPWPPTLPYPEDVAQRQREQSALPYVMPDWRTVGR